MRWNRLLIVLLLLALAGCRNDLPTQEKLEKRCSEIMEMYRDLYESAGKTVPENRWELPRLSQTDIDAMEDRLRGAGLDVLDSREQTPEYLATGDKFRSFLEKVSQGETSQQEVISLRSSGDLGYRLFTCEDGQITVYSMVSSITGEDDPVYEVHSVLDWELTDSGNFYYSIYPQWDKHYVAYTLIRLEAPEEALWELNRRYIHAGGYVGSNLFLTDWSEADFSGLCFNDLWEYLYRYVHGVQFSPEGYVYSKESHCYEIPAQEFEEIILPYFHIDEQTLRTLARFDPEKNAYPWRQIQGNDLVSILQYHSMEPEVTASRVNPDGSITLTVQVLSVELKTDCLFSHEVTVRPGEGSDFQFVSNEILFQKEQGLPYCQPRFSWPVSG